MALVGHISGSSQSNSVIGVSGSVIIANRSGALFPALPGADVAFFVSGSSTSDMALFGGGLVSSGSVAVKNTTGVSQFVADATGVTVKDSSGNNKFTVAASSGNTVVQGTFQSVGSFTATGGLTATSITGSITKLAGGGDYLVAGNNITLTTGSNGSVTIAASAGGTPGGADTQVQFNNGGAFAGDAQLTYNSTSDTLTGVTGSFYRVVASDEVRANGGSVTTTQTTFNLVNSTATTLNVGGAATALALGASTGTATVNNATVTLANATALNVNGANPTVASTSTGTLTLFNTNLLTANAFGAATAITMGDATAATTTIRGGTLVGNLTTQNLFNTTATTLNVGGAATSITMGDATSATTSIRGGTLVGNTTTQNLFNTTATTLNVGGAADVNVGGAAKTVTVAGALTVAGVTTLNGNTTLGDANTDTITFNARSASSFLPSADVTYDLGSSTRRWANIYTGDLHLKNERGDYTLIEEPDFLTIRFNKTGKRYKFVLEAVPEMDEELGNFSSGPKG